MEQKVCAPAGPGCGGKGRGAGWRGGMGGFGAAGGPLRIGRMLAQGDLKLIALALIAQQPRHGYDIIKALEERTAGLYAPSPGAVYPTLTWLEEVGHVASRDEGMKKLYAVTAEGRVFLEQNRGLAEAILDRLADFGARATQARKSGGDGLPPLVEAALVNLRAVAAQKLAGDAEAEAEVVAVLARAAGLIRKAGG